MRTWFFCALGLVLAIGTIAFPLLAGTATAASQAVSMTSNLRFVPDPITIPVGTTVTWTNTTTNIHHTTTSDTLIWDSGTVNPGNSFSVTFNTPGTFTYHCSFHQSFGMVGTITVQSAATSTPTVTETPTVAASATSTATSTATATATRISRPTRTPTATHTRVSQPTRTPTATHTRVPRPTRTPTATVTPPHASSGVAQADDSALDGT